MIGARMTRVAPGRAGSGASVEKAMMRRLIGHFAAATVVLLLAMAVDTAPRPDSWQRWQAHRLRWDATTTSWSNR